MKETSSEDRTLAVNVLSQSYSVHIGSGIRRLFGRLFTEHARGRAFWVTDKNVADAWGETLGGLCAQSATDMIIMPPGEEQKTFATVERICQILADMGAERGDTLVACGGGVVGDIVGFAAAIYLRGVSFIQVPTTLLAMVDASVGGKTGVDLPQGKNLIGAFHQPRYVLIDTDFLGTLDQREFLSGYAEIIKTTLIGNPELYISLRDGQNETFFHKDPEILSQVISACVAFKAEIVEQDEKENDRRRILNFGHTIGHALEAAGEYARLKHGEAVFWGMSAALDLSEMLGFLDHDKAADIQATLLPYLDRIPRLPFKNQDIINFIRHDKKVTAGVPHFILLEDIGKPVIADQVEDSHIDNVLEHLQQLMNKHP